MIPTLESLSVLAEPFEVLELASGGTFRVRPTGYSVGKATIHPRDGRAAKEIVVLRLEVAATDKATLPRYWDVTSKTLIAGMLGYLEAPGGRRWQFTVTKYGDGAAARFSLDTIAL
jgi:hypothetical protein